jgi:hypothetical protein
MPVVTACGRATVDNRRNASIFASAGIRAGFQRVHAPSRYVKIVAASSASGCFVAAANNSRCGARIRSEALPGMT